MTMHHLFHLLDFCLLIFLCRLIHGKLTAMKAILKVKILFKIFFLEDLEEITHKQRERIAVAVAEKTVTTAPKKANFSENFSKVFPKADEFFDNELKNDDI